jgi:hypothetical protein
VLTPVAVEKLPSAKITKIKLPYDAPQSMFSIRRDIFYPPISDRLERKRSFSTVTPDFNTNLLSSKAALIWRRCSWIPDSGFVVDCWPMNLAGVAPVGAAQIICLLFLPIISSCQTATPVTLRMSWTLGDMHYGPNFVSLQSKCANHASTCSCRMNFKVISSSPNSSTFADYIRSFGNSELPVTFKVLHGAGHKILGAALMSVGDWSSERFATNDRLLGVEVKFEPGKDKNNSKVPLSSPGDCFPPD